MQETDKYLAITFCGNGDLYWSLHSSNIDGSNIFIITKENYGLYSLFQQLFRDIKLECEKNDDYNELYDGDNEIITCYSD